MQLGTTGHVLPGKDVEAEGIWRYLGEELIKFTLWRVI